MPVPAPSQPDPTGPPGAFRRRERGATTAEYAVGTLGAATCAAVLVRLGVDGWFLDQLRELFVRALDPVALVEHLRRTAPWSPLR